MDASTPQREIITRFNSATETVSFDGLSNGQIGVHSAVEDIVFQLAAVATVFFPSNPIQWVDGNLQPIDPPSGAVVSRSGNLTTSIRITASEVPSPRLSFYVIVQTLDGRFFGTDPTIVTMRPGDGGN